MAITAATPMTMPRMVRTERMTFRRRACNAIRKVPRTLFIVLAPTKLRNERVLRGFLRGFDAFAGHHFLAIVQGFGGNHRVCAVRRAEPDLDRPNELAVFEPDDA